MKKILRLLKYAREYWGWLILSTVCLLATTILSLAGPWVTKEIISALSTDLKNTTMTFVRNISLVLIAVYILKAVFKYFSDYFSHKASWALVANMRIRIYEHLQKLSLGYYSDKQTGQLLSRTINDTATFEALISHAIPDYISNILVFISVAIILFKMNILLAALTFIPVPFLILSGWIFQGKIRPTFRRAQDNLAALNAVLQDNLVGMKEIQVFNQQKKERQRIQTSAHNHASVNLQANNLSFMFFSAVETIISSGSIIVIGFGSVLALKNYISVAEIVAFLLYLNMFYAPLSSLANRMELLQNALAGADRVFELLDTEPDIVDSPHAIDIHRVKGELTFQKVGFHYIEECPVLEGIDFSAKPGQMIALVGTTGVGKSTIISLIARFYDPVSGKILLDGKDIRSISLASLRNQISIVLQDTFLFNGTIAENIAYGTNAYSMEDIIHCAKVARAHEFIEKLPEGYQAVIGERGMKLSGGQKQRISIARAILRNTPILILDEATASVDVKTESKIQESIQELAGTKTIIVIAHRLSTVKRADRIYVVNEGKVVEAGTHEELLGLDGTYRQLCESQFAVNE